MMFRSLLLLAAVAGATSVMPQSAAAQARGLDRAAVATAKTDENAAWTKNRAAKRPDAMPRGIRKRLDSGETLPPGMRRHFPTPTPEPTPEPEPQPDPSEDDGAGCEEVVLPGGLVVCV